MACVLLTLALYSAGVDFSKDGRVMALAERQNTKDSVSIIRCASWEAKKVSVGK